MCMKNEFCLRDLNGIDVSVPDNSLTSLQKLWALPNPYDFEASDKYFVEAIRECTKYHYQRNNFYKYWLDKKNFNPNDIVNMEDIKSIPFLHANFYKTHTIKTVADKDTVLHVTSSGTSGQKTQMFFDDWTIFAADKSADVQFDYQGYVSNELTNFLLYSYQPAPGLFLGTLRSDQLLMRYAKKNNVEYALKYNGSGHEFDLFGCINTLLRYEKEGLPVYILGFPAFLYFTLESMHKLGYPPLKLNPKSKVLTGGGWKGFVGKQLSSEDFRTYVGEALGLPESSFCDTYGAVEHGIAYIECEHHHLHIPIYSRAFVRDTRTLEVLPYGKPGFLNVISPFNTAVPVVSLLLGDMVVMHKGEDCACGINTPWFEIIGRAGVSKNKSCAIAASELLNKK